MTRGATQAHLADSVNAANSSAAKTEDANYFSNSPRCASRSFMGFRSSAGIQAWMLVLPFDNALLIAPALWTPGYTRALVSMAVLSLLLLTGCGRYRARLHLSVLDELPVVLGRLLTAAAVIASVYALRHDGEGVTGFLSVTMVSILLLLAGRIVTTQAILIARRRGVVAHRTVFVGGGTLAGEVATLIQRYPRYGLSLVGFVDNGSRCEASFVTSQLGSVADLEEVVASHGVEVILVTEGEFNEPEVLEHVRRPKSAPCDLLVVPRLHAFHTQVGLADHIGSIPIMRIRNPSLSGFTWKIKRSFDVLVSIILILITSPVLALCAIAVRMEGGVGVIFKQERVGQDGYTFQCLKFRSMKPTDAIESATNWSVANDQRVGPVGRLLRRTSMDELPQLFNIVKGDMTLVGPRPERPHFVERFSAEYSRYAHRHRVPAGLTGLAQVSGLRGDTPISDRARFDNYYIENWSLWLDAKVILRTVGEVIFAKGR